MKRYDSVKSLFTYSEKLLEEIKILYEESLSKRSLDPLLQTRIKNYLENMRSALEYCAVDIAEITNSHAKKDEVHFPIRSTPLEFEKASDKFFTTLPTVSPNIFKRLNDIQPYNANYKWLGQFNFLTNENKHQNLTPQIVKEIPESATISHGGARIIMGNGAFMKIGKGASVTIGGLRVHDDQEINVNSTEIRGDEGIKFERVIWSGFVFSEIDRPALALLNEIQEKIPLIIEEIYKELRTI